MDVVPRTRRNGRADASLFPNPILLIIILFGAMETWRRWQQRGTRSLEQAAYYRVSPRNRVLVGAVYIGLIIVLVLGMEQSHVLSLGRPQLPLDLAGAPSGGVRRARRPSSTAPTMR